LTIADLLIRQPQQRRIEPLPAGRIGTFGDRRIAASSSP
jgi:hypothetical protein